MIFLNKLSIYMKKEMDININLGVAKAIVFDKISNEFINESKINNSKNEVFKLVETISKSPVLIYEFYAINNIENASTDNDFLASKLIDSQIKLFEGFTVDEIKNSHKLLESFISESAVKSIDNSKLDLYNSISTLIVESLKDFGESDVNKTYKSYEKIINYIKNNVNENEEKDKDSNVINENTDIDHVIKIATNIYNEKYSSLNENEKKIVEISVYGTNEEKKNLFEEYKNYNTKKLKSIDSNGIEDKINEAIDKLNKLSYNEDNFVKDIGELYTLRKSLD